MFAIRKILALDIKILTANSKGSEAVVSKVQVYLTYLSLTDVVFFTN